MRGWRIAKEKAGRKIDAIVALAMACVAALEKPPRNPDLPGPEAHGVRATALHYANWPSLPGPRFPW